MSSRTGAIPKRLGHCQNSRTRASQDEIRAETRDETQAGVQAEQPSKEDVTIDIEVTQEENETPTPGCWSQLLTQIRSWRIFSYFGKKVFRDHKKRTKTVILKSSAGSQDKVKTPNPTPKTRLTKKKKNERASVKRGILYTKYSRGEKRNKKKQQLLPEAPLLPPMPEIRIPAMKPKKILMPKFDPSKGKVIEPKSKYDQMHDEPGCSKNLVADDIGAANEDYLKKLRLFQQWTGEQSGLELFKSLPDTPFHAEYIKLSTFFANRFA